MRKYQSVSTMLIEVLQKSALPLTRVELGQKLSSLTKDQVRKSTNSLVASGKIVQVMSPLGVPSYEIAPEPKKAKPKLELVPKPKKVPKAPVLTEEKKATIMKAVEPPTPTTPELDLQAAYLRGYNDGVYHANRDGFNAGRKAVLKGLTKLLGIDAEILL